MGIYVKTDNNIIMEYLGYRSYIFNYIMIKYSIKLYIYRFLNLETEEGTGIIYDYRIFYDIYLKNNEDNIIVKSFLRDNKIEFDILGDAFIYNHVNWNNRRIK
jgi:hypothetical protein